MKTIPELIAENNELITRVIEIRRTCINNIKMSEETLRDADQMLATLRAQGTQLSDAAEKALELHGQN
jgi:hypothetical protein